MPPNVLLEVPFSDSDDFTIITALHQIAPQVFRHASHDGWPDVGSHRPNAVVIEVAHHTTMSVKRFFAVVQEKRSHLRRDAALLLANQRVLAVRQVHSILLRAPEGGRGTLQ